MNNVNLIHKYILPVFFFLSMVGFFSIPSHALTLDGENYSANGGYYSFTYYANGGSGRQWSTVRRDFVVTDYSSPVYAFAYTTLLSNGYTSSWNVVFYSLEPFSYNYTNTRRFGSSVSSSQSSTPEISSDSSSVSLKYNNTDLYVREISAISMSAGFNPDNSRDKVTYDTFETSYPFSDMHNLNSIVNYIVSNGGIDVPLPVDPSSLGFLSDVKYFVDSASYYYDQANTSEYISWGIESTTGLDLSNDRYYVEFMLEDKSTFLRNSASDSWVASMPYGSAVAYAEDKLAYLSGYVFPSGSDQRALLQGKLAKTSLYGQKVGIGTTKANTRQFSFSCAQQYKSALSNPSDSDKGLIYDLVDGVLSNNMTWQEKLLNNFNASGKNLNFTYDIYAAIIDTASGARGDWLLISRHNSPVEYGADSITLNGRVTASTGHVFYNVGTSTKFVPSTTFQPTSDDSPSESSPVVNSPLPVGYRNPATGDFITTYNNYQYFYYNTNNNNTYNENNTFYNMPDTDVVEDQNNILEAVNIFKSLGILSGIFALLFSPILSSWASGFVALAFVIIVAFAVWRCIKGVLPFV